MDETKRNSATTTETYRFCSRDDTDTAIGNLQDIRRRKNPGGGMLYGVYAEPIIRIFCPSKTQTTNEIHVT